MTAYSHRVALVVDRNYGNRLAQLARHMDVWVVESLSNTPVIQELWREATALGAGQSEPTVTSFAAPSGEAPEAMCARIAGDIDEHHGEFTCELPWSEVAVYGAAITADVRRAFAEIGATEFIPVDGGFIVRRSLG